MSESSDGTAVEELTPADLDRRIAGGERWQLLDVREPWETSIASIEGSLEIPMGEIARRHGELDRTRPVAVLCHSGVRSRRVAEWLVTEGFSRVANVSGGIDAWSVELDPSVPRY